MLFGRLFMDIYDSLNDMQREAVMHERGPLLILAGAGSGKTRVITHRIARLIRDCGVNPKRILAITFTNKAADEMKQRVAALLDDSSADVWVSTFHSACVRMLRKYCESIGYEQNFAIYDTDDQKRAMRDVIRRLNLDPKKFPVKQVLSAISSAKNELIGPEDFRASTIGRQCAPEYARAYREYQDLLQKSNAFDFDDLLMKTVEMLSVCHEALAYYQNRFEYILVDEYQDTNTAQFALIRLLATHINAEGEPEHNLCVVGDDDQSIYRFRGANIRNILDFEKTYPDARVIKLEQNYRSTKHILEAANTVIANNRGRKDKSLWSDKGEGDLIRVTEYPNDIGEALGVVNDIARTVRETGECYKDFAILYRTNAQSRAFEEQFVRLGIPYRLVGGTNFYERMEIRDILAYLHVIDNGNDAMAVHRIINVPKRSIGDTTMDRVDEYAYIKDITLYEALCSVSEIPKISTRAANAIREFLSLIEDLRERVNSPGYPLPQIIDDILTLTGYEEDLRAQDPEKADDRLDNVTELKNKLAQYVSDEDQPTLSGFLSEVALVADIDSLKGDSAADYVVLMTLHSAKGLEFDHVYIGGLEEGLFPSHIEDDEPEDYGTPNESLEEERRLFYVGITRARKTLALSYTEQRMMRGEFQYNRPSRFLAELPRNLVKRTTDTSSSWSERSSASRGSLSQLSSRFGSRPAPGSGRSPQGQSRGTSPYEGSSSYGGASSYGGTSYGGSSYGNSRTGGNSDDYFTGGPGSYRAGTPVNYRSPRPQSPGGAYKNPYTSTPATKPAATPTAPSSGASDTSTGLDFHAGDHVRHVKFGVGTVIEISRGSHDFEVTVDFPAGRKVMLASFAKLVKVDG